MTNQYLNGWKQEEIDYLKRNYGKIFVSEIAKKLNRNKKAIIHKANRLNLYSPFSDFINNNPSKIPKIKEKIRKYQQERWNDKTSILNSEKYRKKQSNSLKKVWKNPLFNVLKRNKQIGLSNKGKIRTEEMIENYKRKHKELWKNPKFKEKMKPILKERVKEMLNNQHNKPTKPEMQVEQICRLNNLPFNFNTRDNKIRINRRLPDFLNENLKFIIEVNGEYWHKDKNREKRKKRTYNSLGYKLLIIWSKELKNPQKVTEKIINFLLI